MSDGILIIHCNGDAQSDPGTAGLVDVLRKKGASVREVELKGNHGLILDLLEQGERPCVLKRRL